MVSKLDIVNRAVAGLGGPPEKPGPIFTALVATRVEPELAARVAAAAEREGRTVSNFVRKVLIDRLGEGG